ncbi:MAG TPA: hypothetical protein VFX31_06290 [Ktedonobacterales bacterium]|jgi:hypothetical protein|nr:hypothetical protein [Ktedonobacterales bacterium]
MTTNQQPPTSVVPVVVPVLTPIQMGVNADGSPITGTPHSTLCARFAEQTARYWEEIEQLKRRIHSARVLIAAQQAKQQAQPTRAQETLRTIGLLQQRMDQLSERLLTLRGEVHAWLAATALVCPECAQSLRDHGWPGLANG